MIITESSPLGSVGARVEGPLAWVPASQVTGSPEAVAGLALRLADRLRVEYGVTELRAPAPTEALYQIYLTLVGMEPWCEIVSYRRPARGVVPPRRTAASIRAACAADRPALTGLGTNPDRPGRWAVADASGVVAGYTYSHLDEAGGQFRSMVVDPRFRRRGIGWDLVCDVLAWFEAEGVCGLLRTEADNVAARALYEAVGFQFVDQTRFLRLALRVEPKLLLGG